MAGKEGVFLILNIGKSMSKQYSNTEMTRLDLIINKTINKTKFII